MKCLQSLFLFTFLISTGCNLTNSYKSGDVYLCRIGKGSFYVTKILDINNDRIYICEQSDINIINKSDYGACSDYQQSFMTEEEKNHPLASERMYQKRRPDGPWSRDGSITRAEFSNSNPIFLKNEEVGEKDKENAKNFWKDNL